MVRKCGITAILALFFLFSFAQEKKKEGKDSGDKEKNEKRNFADRLYFGGNFGLQFGTITFVDFSPAVGYRLTDDLSVGIGGSYRFIRYPGMVEGMSIYGPRAFGRYQIFENLFTYGEYEILYGKFGGIGNLNYVESLLAGGGYSQSIGERAQAFIVVLWNFKQSAFSPYTNPVIRSGVTFNFR